MAHNPKCLDLLKAPSNMETIAGSTNQDKQIASSKAEVMQACINKIHQVGGAARLLNKKLDNSWNQIAEGVWLKS